MNPLVFDFYRYTDCVGADGRTPDYGKMASVLPVESVKAKPKPVLRMHLAHLGFEISRSRPDLEGETLDVELKFEGKAGEPGIPVLVALHRGKPVASRIVRLQTLDTGPFMSLVLKRRPELKRAYLLFTVSELGSGDRR
jgi:hypothetical protein